MKESDDIHVDVVFMSDLTCKRWERGLILLSVITAVFNNLVSVTAGGPYVPKHTCGQVLLSTKVYSCCFKRIKIFRLYID